MTHDDVVALILQVHNHLAHIYIQMCVKYSTQLKATYLAKVVSSTNIHKNNKLRLIAFDVSLKLGKRSTNLYKIVIIYFIVLKRVCVHFAYRPDYAYP